MCYQFIVLFLFIIMYLYLSKFNYYLIFITFWLLHKVKINTMFLRNHKNAKEKSNTHTARKKVTEHLQLKNDAP
jgi:hypothetical protein